MEGVLICIIFKNKDLFSRCQNLTQGYNSILWDCVFFSKKKKLFVAKVAIILKKDLAKSGYESKKTFNCPSISLATHLKSNIVTKFLQSLLFSYPRFF